MQILQVRMCQPGNQQVWGKYYNQLGLGYHVHTLHFKYPMVINIQFWGKLCFNCMFQIDGVLFSIMRTQRHNEWIRTH